MKKFRLLFISALIFVLSLALAANAFAALTGDVDGDGKISAADARLTLRTSVGLEALSAAQTSLADVDGIKGITAADARLILRASVGLETLGEAEKEEEHVHDYSETEVTTEATCSGRGRVKKICSCGEFIREYTPALGHDYRHKETVDATCTVKGKIITECSRCYITKTEYTDKIAHSYTVVVSEKKPTCTAIGHIELKCETCSLKERNKLEKLSHDYDSKGLCKMCGNSDPNFYEKIAKGGTWVVEGNWEISIESVKTHSLDSSAINKTQGYTNEQCVMITYNVKNTGFKSIHENATNGLSVSPLKFNVYDETGAQANNYVCKHTKYPAAETEGLSDTGTVPVVLMNNSKQITFILSLTDSDGVIRRALFTADITA